MQVQKFQEGNKTPETITFATGTYDKDAYIKALANANRSGYTFTNAQFNEAINAIQEGRATQNADGSWTFKGSPTLDNQTNYPSYSETETGEVGWKGAHAYDGKKQKSHGIFTDKDSKAKRDQYAQLGDLAAFLNGVLKTQNEFTSSKEGLKSGKDYLTNLNFADAPNWADLNNYERAQYIASRVDQERKNLNFGDYNWEGTPYLGNEQALMNDFESSYNLVNGITQDTVFDDNFLWGPWKFNSIKSHFVQPAVSQNPADAIADEYRDLYLNAQLNAQRQEQLNVIQAEYNRKLDEIRNKRWTLHLENVVNPHRSLTKDYSYKKNLNLKFTDADIEQARTNLRQALAVHVSNPSFEGNDKQFFETNAKYLQMLVQYWENAQRANLSEETKAAINSQFRKVNINGKPYYFIMSSFAKNGFGIAFKKGADGKTYFRVVHQTWDDDPNSDLSQDYKDGYYNAVTEEYQREHPAPTIDNAFVPAHKDGGTIEILARGGQMAYEQGLPSMETIRYESGHKAEDDVERRVIHQGGWTGEDAEWVDPDWNDILRLGTLGADLVSISGGITGLVGAGTSLIGNLVADLADVSEGELTAGEALKNFGIGTLFTAGSVLPGVGAVKTASTLAKFTRYIPWLLQAAALGGMAVNHEALGNAWKNLIDGNFSSRDAQLVGQTILAATSGIKGIRSGVQASRMAKSATKTPMVVTKSGNRVAVTTPEQQKFIDTFDSTKPYDKLNQQFKQVFNTQEDLAFRDSRNVVTRTTQALTGKSKPKNVADLKVISEGKVGEYYTHNGKVYQTDPVLRGWANLEMPDLPINKVLNTKQVGFTEMPKGAKPTEFGFEFEGKTYNRTQDGLYIENAPEIATPKTTEQPATTPKQEAAPQTTEPQAQATKAPEGQAASQQQTIEPQAQQQAQNNGPKASNTVEPQKIVRGNSKVVVAERKKAIDALYAKINEIKLKEKGVQGGVKTKVDQIFDDAKIYERPKDKHLRLIIQKLREWPKDKPLSEDFIAGLPWAKQGGVLKATTGTRIPKTIDWNTIGDDLLILNGDYDDRSVAWNNDYIGMNGRTWNGQGRIEDFKDPNNPENMPSSGAEFQSVKDYENDENYRNFKSHVLTMSDDDPALLEHLKLMQQYTGGKYFDTNGKLNPNWKQIYEDKSYDGAEGYHHLYKPFRNNRNFIWNGSKWEQTNNLDGYTQVGRRDTDYGGQDAFYTKDGSIPGDTPQAAPVAPQDNPITSQTDVAPTQAEDLGKFKTISNRILRYDLPLDIGQMIGTNLFNLKNMKRQLNYPVALQDPYKLYGMLREDMAGMEAYKQIANQLRSISSRAYTNDAALQAGMQISSESEGGNKYIEAANRNANAYYTSADKINQYNNYNIENLNKIAFRDDQAIADYAQNRAETMAQYYNDNMNNFNYLMNQIRADWKQGYSNQKAASLEFFKKQYEARKNALLYAYQQAVRKDPSKQNEAYKKLSQDLVTLDNEYMGGLINNVGYNPLMIPSITTPYIQGDKATNSKGQQQIYNNGQWELYFGKCGGKLKKKRFASGSKLSAEDRFSLQRGKDANKAQLETRRELYKTHRENLKRKKRGRRNGNST